MTSSLPQPPSLDAESTTLEEAPHPGAPPVPATAPDGLAARLKALAHPVRLEVLATLAGQEGCMCGDIVRRLPLAQSTVSEHLKVLSAAGLIAGKVEGQRSCYKLDRARVRALKAELDLCFSALLALPGAATGQDAD